MYRKICVTNRALAERPFLEQLACVLATKPYAMILREKDLTEEGYEELAGKVKKLCENTDTRLILHSFPDAAMHLGGTAIHMPLHRFMEMPEEQKQKFLVRGVSVHSVEDARLAEQCGSFCASGREPVEYVCGRNRDKRAAADLFGADERDRAAHRFFVALYDI